MKELFGYLKSGEAVETVTLKNESCSLKISSLGATIVSFKPFGIDIVGGFDRLSDYENDRSNQGATIGRVANRIENAKFTMDGKEYLLPANNNGNCLHGGRGFNYRIWEFIDITDDSCTLYYYSKDGEEGFPSGLKNKVKFTLKDSTLIIEYESIPEGKTPIALTNHAYFNLNGFGGTIYDHIATIYADRYTDVDERLIPNGKRPETRGTRFDFTSPRKIGERIGGDFLGYDHNFILSPKEFGEFAGKRIGLGARVEGDELAMDFYTDQPGVQFYIGNFLSSPPNFRGEIERIKHGAFCLEAQTEPNSVNLGEGFYDVGETYTQTTVYKITKK